MSRTDPARRRWNHNIHYHQVILGAIPADARSALDVGTGDGLLAVDLSERLDDVSAIDADAAVLNRARGEAEGVEWMCGDVMTHPFGRTFDVIASVATVHHLPDLRAGLQRLADLTAPGGVVAVVGLARSSRPTDYALHLVGILQHRWLSRRRGYWEHSAPIVWPPPHSYSEVRRCAREQLPGAHFRRLAMFRYALIWQKPSAG
ncbi:putative methyltransferase (plasmid) [Gordonia polyisoprenivorans VH2]|uniref:Putative methyltransferase n=1 Tax=Gordonia polyisoprenivorans (strain DSM 44266 / VH2) TaxID=1112204 RepID=H6N5B5_GORPV|nr:class I SAM-dependent methyltransferase [Gordonia polyisoprenivorans]AFA76160.1 putative methyltransferase [Gordonia polyisoprenivorans VH2]